MLNAEDYAVVYLVTQGGEYYHAHFNGNLFVLTIEDAMKFCSDDCSKGTSRGNQWIMMWTSIKKYAEHNNHLGDNKHADRKKEPFVFIKDTGKQDKDFERLGIHKPSIEECKKILDYFDYEFVYK